MNGINKYYFLNIHINTRLTGIERASLLRAKLFYEQLKIIPTVVTVRYHNHFQMLCKQHVEDGILHPKIQVLNMYDWFQGSRTVAKQKQYKKNEVYTYKEVKGTNNYRVFKNDERIKYIGRTKDSLLDYINYFDHQKKIRRHKYDANGYLSVIQILEPPNQRIIEELYFHVDGSIRIMKHYELIDDKNVMRRITVLNEQQEVIRIFSNENELIEYWLKFIFDEQYTYYCFVDKHRIYYEALTKMRKENLKIISCIHAMHTRNHMEIMQSKLNKNYEQVFKNPSVAEAIVVLTNGQTEDIIRRFGNTSNYFIIPHALDYLPDKVNWEGRKPLKVVVLARYSPEKQLDKMISMFAKVVERVPDAILEIYGYGNEREKLLSLIKSLKMEKSIFLKSYVANISEVYDSGVLSLLTSRTEAFSLVTMESLAHGCPMISFDIKYGPCDMIIDGENGYLIPYNHEQLYIEKIIYLLEHPEILQKMSASAYENRQRFDVEHVSKLWDNLLTQLN